MTLDSFIESLKQALSINSLIANDKGFSLMFDDNLAIDIIAAKGNLVFLSPAPTLADEEYQKERQLKQAMTWSLAWKDGRTCLTRANKTLMVQTRISLENDFATLYATLNHHCQFVEQLEQLELQAVQQVNQHVFIRP